MWRGRVEAHTQTQVHMQGVMKAFPGNTSMAISRLDPEASCLHSQASRVAQL